MRSWLYIIFIAILSVSGCKKKEENVKTIPSRDFQAGQYFDYYQIKDSAFYYYNQVIDNSRDSLEKGIAYFKMGLRQLEAGDYYSAQEALLSSIKILDEKKTAHYRNISADYNTLANATLDLKDYDAAIQHYYTALKFTPDGDPKLYVLNNLGVAHQKKADFKKAIAVFDSAIIQTTADTSLKARLISNFARTKWLADSNYVALPEFMSALTLRRLIRDSLGINASFAHLSDYYTNSRPDSALYYAVKRLGIAQTLQDPSDRMEALSQLIKISPPTQIKKYTVQYMKLDDSLAIVHNKDRNQYALIKFDAQKNKADNLLLQKHIVKQRLIIWGTIMFAALVIIGLIIRTRIRRARLKRASEHALRESKLKTSQRVHDVVANGLYRIMNELEHRENMDKESLLNRIERLYEQSRDISYEDIPASSSEYDLQIHQLLTSFATGHTKVIIIGNERSFWNAITAARQQELELVLEELMINMQKHSRAKNVSVHFRQENDVAYVNYKDDGRGFPSGLVFGNGLTNTVNRIKSINGQVIFGKNGGEGVSISMSFPLELP